MRLVETSRRINGEVIGRMLDDNGIGSSDNPAGALLETEMEIQERLRLIRHDPPQPKNKTCVIDYQRSCGPYYLVFNDGLRTRDILFLSSEAATLFIRTLRSSGGIRDA